jgi:polysaccharide deacetylase family protein (PEP-CTERM system associated)
MTSVPAVNRHDLMTVILEDYFHVGALKGLIGPHQWPRFEARFEQNTLKTLDLLKRFDVKATFFVLGWVAERRADLVAEIARQGHEIANYGFYHRDVRQMTREEFREDAQRSRDALELAAGQRVIGFRIPQGLRTVDDHWVLDVLAEEGYAYDSSVVPFLRGEHANRFPYVHKGNSGSLYEFPHTSLSLLGYAMPISGGNYIRQIPYTLLRPAVAWWKKRHDVPFMIYFHVWELDPDLPRISAASLLTRARQYRNLDKMLWVLEENFTKYKFGTVADYIGCPTDASAPPVAKGAKPVVVEAEPARGLPRRPVTLVVPCFNERPALPYLANTLESVRRLLDRDYDLRFVFVDDCSTDDTGDILQRLFGKRDDCRIIRHEKNLGVAAAILTGIRHAQTEVVCSIDCDCTYDPHELVRMIPLLTDDVDLVTASPYHPAGSVMNVPGWRLFLSKGASRLYGKVLHHKLSTYTSCFRVYRRSSVVDLELQELGFLGVAETLGVMDLKGYRIREFPTTLHVRILGHSKMKVVRNIVGHLRNLWRMWNMRHLVERNRQIILEERGLARSLPEAAGQPTNTNKENISK